MLLAEARPGDIIITTGVSRLSRSTKQLCLEILGSITIDCRSGQLDPMTKAFLQMSGIFAELELSMIRSRVWSGMQNARVKGKQIGRPQVGKKDIPNLFLRHYPAKA